MVEEIWVYGCSWIKCNFDRTRQEFDLPRCESSEKPKVRPAGPVRSKSKDNEERICVIEPEKNDAERRGTLAHIIRACRLSSHSAVIRPTNKAATQALFQIGSGGNDPRRVGRPAGSSFSQSPALESS